MIPLGVLALAVVGSVLPQAGEPAAPEAEEAQEVDVRRVLGDAVQWLVENQQSNGSWGTHHTARPIEVLASVPGSQQAFRVGTTGLVVAALQECPLAGDDGLQAAERGKRDRRRGSWCCLYFYQWKQACSFFPSATDGGTRRFV